MCYIGGAVSGPSTQKADPFGSASVYTGVPPCPFDRATGNSNTGPPHRFFGHMRLPKISEMTNKTKKM